VKVTIRTPILDGVAMCDSVLWDSNRIHHKRSERIRYSGVNLQCYICHQPKLYDGSSFKTFNPLQNLLYWSYQ
jgi:hypothetical protein